MKYYKPSIIIIFSLFLSSSVNAQADQGFVADLVYQVQQLQEEVRQLRGQVEQQSHELDNLKSRQRDQYLDLDSRLGELQKSSAGIATPAAINPSEIVAVDTQVGAVVTTGSVINTPALDSAAVALPGNQTVAVEAPAIDDKTAYQQAFTHLKELRYTEAAESFYAFLETYPDSPLAGNAEYWLGESYYVTRNYDFALESFQRLLEKYPDSKKVPDAWLKTGYTYYEMGEYQKAADTLERVKQQYPDTTLAKLADSRLKTMRLENTTSQ
ncbi:MAG: tol-pal system protein YbgF [Proteobacteria bacterium]|nr:tol-pal system protein YbgF [Pseudomonadota bacterium]